MEENTEITQLPAVYRNGEVVIMSLDWKNLDFAKLQELARGAGGTVGYKKVRATYTDIEHDLCSHYDCYHYSLPGTSDCGIHG
jgi:hypothetical protein